MQFREKVAVLKDFNEAFELVKAVVLQRFKMHRAGLSLILQMMPSNLGAYHMLGSNAIVMNSYLLAAVKKIAGSTEEYLQYLLPGILVMSKEDPSTLYPQLRSLMQTQFSRDFKVVNNFDRANQTYIQ